MGIISKGIGLGRTIRNVGRLREIVSIFAKNGFDEFMNMGITSKIPDFVLPRSTVTLRQEMESRGDSDWSRILGHRLRLSFEELGPTFVKIGQLLSTREDIFDPAFIEEMQLLRDKVRPVPFEQAKEAMEKSFGKPLDQVFASLDPNPIGTASIGVVYGAKLKTGEDVVVKLRRPNIEKAIETDFSLLLFIVGQVERASSEVRYLGMSRILKDFEATLHQELNFNIEANNCDRLRSNLVRHKGSEVFYIPSIYRELTHEDVLVMERVQGVPFSDKANLGSLAALAPKLETGIGVFIKTFLQDGLFHADLHGGNFFLRPDGSIGIIDFGLVGTLGKRARQNFLAIVYALLTSNFENLVYEFLDVAEYDSVPDVEALIQDVREALAPYIGLTVQQTDFSRVLQSVITTLTRHKIFLPRDWFIVFRAFITLDGVGRSLGLDFDIFSIFEKDIHGLIQANLGKEQLIEEAAWAARDLLPITRTLPRHLRWFTREWARKGYAFEIRHSGHEASVDKIHSALVFLALSILAGIFFSSGASFLGGQRIAVWRDIPNVTWIFWGIGGALFLRGLSFLKK